MALNENQIRNNITKSVQNQIASQRQAINNPLAQQKQQMYNGIKQNDAYLKEQISGLNTTRHVNDDQITALNNRRGGFYSGGLDYSLSENLRNTTNSQNTITRDINNQNQKLRGDYQTLATQAANQISLLEQQAPDKIRELVNAELDRQRANQMEQEKWALQKQQMELELKKLRSSLSGGGGSGRGRSGGGSKGNPSAVPASVQQFAKSNATWFTPTNGKEQMTYSTNGITRQSPVGNFSPQQNVQPSTVPYKFTPKGKAKQYSY